MRDSSQREISCMKYCIECEPPFQLFFSRKPARSEQKDKREGGKGRGG